MENKTIPQLWKSNSNYKRIISKVMKDEQIAMKSIINSINNHKSEEYNKKLKEKYPNLLKKYRNKKSFFEIDEELMALRDYQQTNKVKEQSMKTLDEEYKELIEKQNSKIEPKKPDSLKENLNDILQYRKRISLRFKYDKFKFIKKCLPKSKSQLMIDNLSYIHNIPLFNNPTNVLNSPFNNISNSMTSKYQDEFLITGMNNKQFASPIGSSIIKELPV